MYSDQEQSRRMDFEEKAKSTPALKLHKKTFDEMLRDSPHLRSCYVQYTRHGADLECLIVDLCVIIDRMGAEMLRHSEICPMPRIQKV